MKKSTLAFLICLFCIGLASLPVGADNWKTVERSENKTPAWLQEAIPEGYLAISTEAPSLQEARRMAEHELLRCIVQAVAANVSYSTLQTISSVNDNGKIDENDSFSSDFVLNAAKLPFIKGVSLSEAKASYWERRENKQNRQNIYVFSMLYPLPESDLSRMRRYFQAYDEEKSGNFERVRRNIDSVASSFEIDEAISTLTQLKEYFFDSVRQKEAETLLQRHRNLYRAVYLDSERLSDNHYRVYTRLDGRSFKTDRRLEVTSDCAYNIKVVPTPEGDAFDITFSTDDCIPGEMNSLKAAMRLDSNRLSVVLPL